MSQNTNSTSTTLPTARKSRRASQRKRPVLVSSTSQEIQGDQGSQVGTLEPETENTSSDTVTSAEASVPPEVPAKAQRVSRLPSFFSKVEKTQEESETSQEEVVKARLARAQKTAPNVEVTPATTKTKEAESKPTQTANRAAATNDRPKLFKTRHFVGMMIYLFGAEIILPLEANLIQKSGFESVWLRFSLFNLPMSITTSVFVNLATLVVLLLTLVKLDLLPKSMASRAAATTRKQQTQAVSQKQQTPVVRQGVKGEDDDLYYAYRNNQRREKKH